MNRGFTILESLLAAFLLTTIFFVVISLYPAALLSIRKAHDLTAASNVATTAMETARAATFSTLVDGTTTTSTTLDGTQFNVSQTVSAVNADVKNVHVVVTWSSGAVAARASVPLASLDYETRLYNYRE